MRGLWKVWPGLVIAGALLAATAAMAQGPGNGMGQRMGPGNCPGFGEHRSPLERAFGPGGDHGRWWNNPRVVARLKLSDEQRKDFDGILLAHREKLIDLRASLEKAELALEPLVREDQPDEAGILAQIDKVAQARAELEKANARFLLAIRAKLTPEQWKLVQERWEDRGGWAHDGQRRNWQGMRGQGLHQAPAPPQAPPDAQPQQQAPPAPPAGDEQ